MAEPSPRPGLQGAGLPGLAWHGRQSDLMDLLRAVRTNLGPCECVVHVHPIFGPCEGHPCAGHVFLAEEDPAGRTLEWTVPQVRGATHFTSGALHNCVSRLDRLLFARSQRVRWVSGEHGALLEEDPDALGF